MVRRTTSGRAPSRQLTVRPVASSDDASLVKRDVIAVNREALDKLVDEHLELAKGLPDHQHRILEKSRHIVELASRGKMQEALDATSVVAPEPLQDQRLLFKLKLQLFLELARSGSEEDLAQAIEFLRVELAPLALNAYPEAYDELKLFLPLLVVREATSCQLSRPEWTQESRERLAAQLGRIIRQAHGAVDSRLSLLLRYLAAIHQKLCSGTAKDLTHVPTAEEAALVKLLGVDATKRVPPQFACTPSEMELEVGSGLASFPITQVMMLRVALHMPNSEAVESLRVAKGDMQAAFLAEVDALPLDTAALDRLVAEYQECRSSAASQGQAGGPCEEAADGVMEERRSSGQDTSSSECPFTPDFDVSAGMGARDCSRSPPKKVARHCSVDRPAQTDSLHPLASGRLLGNLIRGVRWNIEQGLIDEALVGIEELERHRAASTSMGFLERHPALDFELHSAKFKQLLNAGDTAAALILARTRLASLSEGRPPLQSQLKVVLSGLIPGATTSDSLPLGNLAERVETELRVSFDIQDPQLVRLLKVLLEAHDVYYSLQHCADPFKGCLDIDRLSRGGAGPEKRRFSFPCRPPPPPPVEEYDVPPQYTVEYESMAIEFDEEVIAEAMEITALGRAAVINLLRDVDGDLERLLEQLFQ